MATPLPNIPSPDPSLLTTAQLHRELSQQREFIEARLDGMDKATVILAENVNRVPTLLDREISRVLDLLRRGEELTDEKLAGVAKQFFERDVRSSASEVAASTAVSAALQAQKEAAAAQNEANAAAITKSEAATIKQIDGILALLASSTKAIDDKIAVINGRLDRGEGGSGAVRRNEMSSLARTDTRNAGYANMIAIGGVLLVVISAAVGLFAGTHSAPPPPVVIAAPVH